MVGDHVAIATLNSDREIESLFRSEVVWSSEDKVAVCSRATRRGRELYRRRDGARITSAGKTPAQGPVCRIVGLWKYGETDPITGVSSCRRALRAGAVSQCEIKDPRQLVLAQYVPEICAVFGVDPDSLRERTAADQTDPDDLAHNGLRKFAVGAVVHLAYEIDVAWSGRGGGVSRQGLRAVAEVPQLQGVHRGTLGSFREQFAALAGLGVDDRGRVREPRSGVGRYVRDRYVEIRRAAVEAAALATASPAPDA